MVLKSGPVMTNLLARQPVMSAEAIEPIDHEPLMMMSGLAKAHKVGVLLLVVCSIFINCPVKIRCPV
jgi:hypothetical protein